jgi:anthranilate synthase component I
VSGELFNPGFERFRELAREFNRVPVVATLICDELTPVSAFARLQTGSPRAFLLESVVGGEKIARYSFLGADPSVTFEATRDRVRLTDHAANAARESISPDPLAALESHLHQFRGAHLPGLPRFLGGAVGYAAYDTVRYCERLPNSPPDDRGLPDLLFDTYETMVIFDHVQKTLLVVSHATTQPSDAETVLRQAYEAAIQRISAVVDRIGAVVDRAGRPVSLHPVQVALPAPPLSRYTSNFERSAYEAMVERCKEYIRAGDIFQVVVSQRLEVTTRADPFDVYRALRVVNPSPFMFYLKSPTVTLVGASPEVMCRVEAGVVTNRPLAGTRPRGRTDAEDRRLRAELLADPKERAEHIMLVDLGRNDVGRVAKPASVRVSETMTVEYYSHVMHISSTVTGEMAEGKTAFDALRAALPVGTVSGAPKVRAMQIIDEFEPTRRGPYAGAVGYVDFAGNMDTCIALRTLVVQPAPPSEPEAAARGNEPVGARAQARGITEASGRTPVRARAQARGTTPESADSAPSSAPFWQMYIQAGAGIVADSVPASEYQETLNKAQGMLTAIRMAEERFGGG